MKAFLLFVFGILCLVLLTNYSTSAKEYKGSSVLASGSWVKVSTSKRGIHKITFNQLAEWGISNPQQVRIYGNGGEVLPKMNSEEYPDDLMQVPIWIGTDGTGTQCVFFYAPGMVRWEYDTDEMRFIHLTNEYSEKAYYYISGDGGQQAVVAEAPVINEPATISTDYFNDYQLYEEEANNVLHSGRRWLGAKINKGGSEVFNYSFPGMDATEPAKITFAAAVRAKSGSDMVVSGPGFSETVTFSSVTFNVNDTYARYKKELFFHNLTSSSGELSVAYTGTSGTCEAWLDYIELEVRRKITLEDTEQLFFCDPEVVGEGNIAGYILSDYTAGVKVWDISNFSDIMEVKLSENGSEAAFKAGADELKYFVAFDPAGATIFVPELEGEVPNQNLHGTLSSDFIIVSHPELLLQAERLAQFHREKDGFEILVATTEQVFNEFSSGMKDAASIRNLAKMCYDRGGEDNLKYLLLFGDGSYDNRNLDGTGDNMVPTYQSLVSFYPIESFVSDDFFGLLDDDEGEYFGDMDIGIGRIPAGDVEEAKVVVDKIINYSTNNTLGDWRNKICLIADDEDGHRHLNQSESLSTLLKGDSPEYLQGKIYFDAYQQEETPAGERYPDVNRNINESVKEGALILNYIGHANTRFLSAEQVLTRGDIDSWSNYDRLPVFVTATCEFSRFDDDEESSGEGILLNPNGGGIGLFSTTRVVNSTPNFVLTTNFFKNVFGQDENGQNLRMGDVMRLAKNETSSLVNKRNFTLLADPALSLAFPSYKVFTTRVNGQDADGEPLTINALTTVTVEGIITDANGNKQQNFNGDLIPVVLDKSYQMETLGNDENPTEIELQDNVLYKGLVTIENGEFSFSFVVPKDISYKLGSGLISYYAWNTNDNTDGNGAFKNFQIGGSGSLTDNEGPQITLYLNDEGFESGDKTNKSPQLIALLSDENGINTVGTGIGHDVTLVIDDDYSSIIDLNAYYQSDRDSYQSGRVDYQLFNLAPGSHTLKLKAWDIAGNSSEKEIEFVVTDDFQITETGNYPNPVRGETTIWYKHNQPGETMQVQFDLFSPEGIVVHRKSDQYTMYSVDGRDITIDFNNDVGNIRSGAYIYRILLTNSDGNTTAKSGRLLLLRDTE